MEDDSDTDDTPDTRERAGVVAVVMHAALSIQLAMATLWVAFVAVGEQVSRSYTRAAEMREYVLASVVVWLSSTLAYGMTRGGARLSLAMVGPGLLVLVGQQRAFETNALEPVFALGPGLVMVLALAAMIRAARARMASRWFLGVATLLAVHFAWVMGYWFVALDSARTAHAELGLFLVDVANTLGVLGVPLFALLLAFEAFQIARSARSRDAWSMPPRSTSSPFHWGGPRGSSST